MDSTEAARRALGGGTARVSYVVPVTGVPGRPSIYAALVAEWQANGRAVPRRGDTRRDFADTAPGQGQTVTSWTVGRFSGAASAADPPPVGGRDTEAADRVPAVIVPRGLPGPIGLWEWSAGGGRVSAAAPRPAD